LRFRAHLRGAGGARRFAVETEVKVDQGRLGGVCVIVGVLR